MRHLVASLALLFVAFVVITLTARGLKPAEDDVTTPSTEVIDTDLQMLPAENEAVEIRLSKSTQTDSNTIDGDDDGAMKKSATPSLDSKLLATETAKFSDF